ncbi:MAG: hypothetical protein ACK4TA_08145 [Saprospiraceae bacterium]
MKKILIISPHFPPSNLAAVHRSRLFAQHLPTFGWEPIILTVHEDYYEEAPDWNLAKLLPPDLRIEKVKALPVTKPRLVGDIGLRAFLQLFRRAQALLQSEKIDFLYIPIPSFYAALLGRWLYNTTGIPYGIDYIDPWVHTFPGSERRFSRHWWSTRLARLLEPIAVKHARLITGVAEGYYQGVLARNPQLRKQAIYGAMPYGGEAKDHEQVAKLNIAPYLFQAKADKIQLVYAGAMLPKAYAPLEAIFQAIQAQPETFANVEVHFIGTGKTPNDPQGYNIRPYAEKYGLWQKVVFEYPRRIPYLDVLVHLEAADGVFILGSTEPHYTPSKVYQGVLSRKPILAVLHEKSSAVEVIRLSDTGVVLSFAGADGIEHIQSDFAEKMKTYLYFLKQYDYTSIHLDLFDTYSAKNVTQQLANLLETAIETKIPA